MSATLSNSGVSFNSGSTLNPSGTAPSYACRAWVRFNTAGTINGQGNVSSVGRNGNGNYTVYFATAMPDANYATAGVVSGNNNGLASTIQIESSLQYSTSAVRVVCGQSQVGPKDPDIGCVSIFR